MADITDLFTSPSFSLSDSLDNSTSSSSLLSNAATGLGIGGAIASGIGGIFASQGQATADKGAALQDQAAAKNFGFQSQADLASSQGYQAEQLAYNQAAGYATGNVALAEESKTIQEYQQQRALTKTLGAQRAGIAAAGLGEGGSGLSLLRDSMAQGALAKGLIGVQGEIQATGYRAQSTADLGLGNQAQAASQAAIAASQGALASQAGALAAASSEENAAKTASTGGAVGAIGGILGGIAKAIPIIGGFFK